MVSGPDPTPVTVEALRQRLLEERLVTVQGLTFRLRKLSPLWFTGDLLRLPADLTQADGPTLARALRPLLLAGVVAPPLTDKSPEDAQNGAVPVDLILSNLDLAADLVKALARLMAGKPQEDAPSAP